MSDLCPHGVDMELVWTPADPPNCQPCVDALSADLDTAELEDPAVRDSAIELADTIDKMTVGLFKPLAEMFEAEARETVTSQEVYKVLAERDEYDPHRDAGIMVLAAAAWRWAKDQEATDADPVAAVRRGVESGEIEGHIVEATEGYFGVARHPIPYMKPGRYLLIPVVATDTDDWRTRAHPPI